MLNLVLGDVDDANETPRYVGYIGYVGIMRRGAAYGVQEVPLDWQERGLGGDFGLSTAPRGH